MSEYVNPVDPPDLGLLPTFRRLLRLWRAEWRLGVLGLSLATCYTLISIVIPVLTQRAIDDAIVADRHPLWPYIALIVALAGIRYGANFTRRYTTARIGIRIEARMRELLYEAYLRYPRAFYDRHATGQVLSRATNDLYPIRYFIGWGLVQGMQSVMMIVAASIVLVVVDARLALYTAVAMPPITVLALRFARRVSPISREVQARKGDVTEAADEAVVGIEMVQAFGREDDVRGRFGTKAEAVRDTVLKQAGVEARHLPGLYYLPSLSIAAVVFFGGRAVIHGQLSIGEFVLFETLLLQLVWPLEALGWITNLAQRALASAGRSFAWLEGIEPLPEPRAPQPLPPRVAAGDPILPGGGGSAAGASSFQPLGVSFRGVHFAYGGEGDVLRGLDLEIEPGEIVAVCGPTGAGKTSLLNLLPRFYDPTGGRVLVGGVDTRDVAVAELRRDVALVTQRPVLFSVPLRENLTAGREDADWEDVLAACEAAGVDAFADDLPDGFDTLIGERGVNLSGGQRQRVALARALVTDARIMVLDDPLSAVDTLTERRLVGRLRPALRGRTVLVATQRLSTIELADRAVVLLDGRIAESGPPAELIRAGGPFAELFGDEVVAA
ncbi:MAG TPA: ABC transporter ATP-binding protein [Gaiellaceae bacterium]|nr:ABC transporter ATP-binding protein [Gaiellaceae bacterium]